MKRVLLVVAIADLLILLQLYLCKDLARCSTSSGNLIKAPFIRQSSTKLQSFGMRCAFWPFLFHQIAYLH
jgi:hypothetical protein